MTVENDSTALVYDNHEQNDSDDDEEKEEEKKVAGGAAEERRRWKMQSERDKIAEEEAEAEAAYRAAGLFWEEEPGRVPIPEVTPDVEIFSPPAVVHDVIDMISDDEEDGVKAAFTPTWRQVRGRACIILCLASCSTVCTI
jgi:hypothetical protein